MCKTPFGLWLVIVEIGILLTGTENLFWEDTPALKTMSERGTNTTIYWKYQLQKNDKFFSSYVARFNDYKRLAVRPSSDKGFTTRVKNMVVSGYSNVTLMIPDVSKSMEEQYCLIVELGSSLQRKNCTHLIVFESPKIVYITPSVTKPQGSLLNLTCRANGDPMPSFVWTKIINKTSQQYFTNSSLVAFNMTDEELSGNYCCVATNKYGNDTACTLIGVPPSMMNTTGIFHRMSNNSVTIACQATGTPTPIIIWAAIDTSNIIQYDGNMTVDFKPCMDTTLIYYCAASNIVGRTEWKSVTVEVDTLQYCNKTSSNNTFTTTDPTDRPTDLQNDVIVTTVVLVVVFIIVEFVIILTVWLVIKKRRKKKKKKPPNVEDDPGTQMENRSETNDITRVQMVESAYEDPIDLISSPNASVPTKEEENPYGVPIDAITKYRR